MKDKDLFFQQLKAHQAETLQLEEQTAEFLQAQGLAVGATFTHDGTAYEVLGWKLEEADVWIRTGMHTSLPLYKILNQVSLQQVNLKIGQMQELNSEIRRKTEERSDVLDWLVTDLSPFINKIIIIGDRQGPLHNVFRRNDRVFLSFGTEQIDVNCLGEIRLPYYAEENRP